PMSRSPWIMTQSWHDLLFAHWPIGARALRDRVPKPLELDQFEGQAGGSIVPFHMTNVVPRGVPSLPWVSAFPELNVRTYVRVGDRPGVYFLNLDAGSTLSVLAGRMFFPLPYFEASIKVERDGAQIRYDSRRNDPGRPAELSVSYMPTGSAFTPALGTLEHFLTERYFF